MERNVGFAVITTEEYREMMEDNINKAICIRELNTVNKNEKEIYENMIINNEYIVVYDFCKFVLKNIKNGNITDFKKEGVYEITREYFE